LEEVIDIIGDYESVVFASDGDELLSSVQGHGFARRIGESRDGVDDMVVGLAPRAFRFEDLRSISQYAVRSEHRNRIQE